MSWIQTFTGRRIDLLDPLPDEISIEDIAYALSNLCRYTGHTSKFYSVAQHSVYVSDMFEIGSVSAEWGLLHDASEAYMNDIASPLKGLLPRYREIESYLTLTIIRKFGLPAAMPENVHRADWAVGAAEAFQLIEGSKDGWRLQEQPADIKIEPCSPRVAHSMFMYRFKQLFPDYVEV